MPQISNYELIYYSAKFPPKYGQRFIGKNRLSFTSHELFWSAITLGKPNIASLLRHGKLSYFEIVYRAAIIFSNLERNDDGTLIRSDTYKDLDPSEKGIVSYYLGNTMARLFSWKLLGVPWIIHLDSLGKRFYKLKKGRSRPDLIGIDRNRNWIVMEAKGRSNNVSYDVIKKAKEQTRKIQSILKQIPKLKIALLAYFDEDELKVNWEDPEGFDEEAINLDISKETVLIEYYRPFANLLLSEEVEKEDVSEVEGRFLVRKFIDLDLEIGCREEYILNFDKAFPEMFEERTFYSGLMRDQKTWIGPDGIMIRLGTAWDEEKMFLEPRER